MREMKFKMERHGLLKEGDKVNVSEGKLPSSYYYTIEPALAMSGNYRTTERLISREGTITVIEETPRGYYATAVFEE